MNYTGRLRLLRSSLAAHRLNYLLVTHLPNICYLCGFTGSAGILVVSAASGKATFFTDGRYTQQARSQVKGARVVIARKPPLVAAADWIALEPAKRPLTVGIEAESMTVASHRRLRSLLPARVRLKPAGQLVEALRMVKDADEIQRIRDAVLLGSSLFDTAVATIRPGVPEVAVAAEMEYAARRAGADAMSFETIIASGTRSALPHGRASDQVIPPGAFVVCDFGVILSGYCSDMTRTVWVGRPDEEARRAYESVRAAQQAAIDAVAAGVSVGEVDQAARKLLKKDKLSSFFTHSTGHGVGLEIHEPPRVAAGQEEVLQPGMVITIEPGVYLPGKWGLRIEDMVVVTDKGCDVLTPTTKELVII